MKNKKRKWQALIVVLLLLLVLPCRVFAEPATETASTESTQRYQQYQKEVDEDTGEAGDLQWYKDNASVLSNRSIIGDSLRAVGFGITKVLCLVADVMQTLYDKTFGLIDMTQYSRVNDIITKLKPVLVALTCLCIAGLGVTLVVKQQRVPVVRNILLGILTVSCSVYLFSMANSLAVQFKSGLLGEESAGSEKQAYVLVNDNMFDLIRIDKRGDIEALNYKSGDGVIYGTGISTKEDMDQLDITETLDWYTKDNGMRRYGWSENFNNRVKYQIIKTDDGYTAVKNYDGMFAANIGNKFYYRYTFNYLSCILQLIALIVLFGALCYKNVRIAYELVVARILSIMYAADIGNGERLKSILFFIRDTYITLCISVLCVKLYTIFIAAIPQFGISGLGKGVVSLLVAYAVIDGPNLVERLLGMDAGLSSSLARTAAVFNMTRGAARFGKATLGAAARGAKNVAMAAATGTTHAERRTGRGGAGAMEAFAAKMRSSRNKEEGAEKKAASNYDTGFMVDNQGREKKGDYDTGFMSDGAGAIAPEEPSRTVRNPALSEAIRNNSPAATAPDEVKKDWHKQMDAIIKGKQHRAIKPAVDAPEWQKQNYERAKNCEAAYHNFNPSGQNAKAPTGLSQATTPQRASMQERVSNPRFIETEKRLRPDMSASAEERKDWHRQVNSITRGKKHKAIEPAADAPVYQQKNYEKAQELEKAYHSIKKEEKK